MADEEFGEKSIIVSLDGLESEIILIDHSTDEMSVSIPLLLLILGSYVFQNAQD